MDNYCCLYSHGNSSPFASLALPFFSDCAVKKDLGKDLTARQAKVSQRSPGIVNVSGMVIVRDLHSDVG